MNLNSQLQADSHYLGEWPEGLLLLHRNASLHWLILVPRTDRSDFLDLDVDQQQRLLELARGVGQVLKENLAYPKVNFAVLGNVVSQQHWHIVGRRPGDACWPKPVWGNLPEGPVYSSAAVQELQQLLRDGCGLRG